MSAMSCRVVMALRYVPFIHIVLSVVVLFHCFARHSRMSPLQLRNVPGQVRKTLPGALQECWLTYRRTKVLCRRHGLCAQQLHDYDRGVSCGFDGDGLLRIECSIGDCVGHLRLLPKKNEGSSSNMFAFSSSGGLLRFTLDLFAGPVQKAAARQGGVSASSHSF